MPARIIHGHLRGGRHATTRTYEAWRGMKKRCYQPGNASYAHYSAKGIMVCERWRSCFPAFLADMGECPPGASLDRYPDNSGNYEPGNCRWATAKQQAENRSNNRLLTFSGETLTVTEWARRLNVTDVCLLRRLKNGLSVEDVLGASRRDYYWSINKRQTLTFNGETLTLREWSERLGLTAACLNRRIKRGLSVEQVLYAGDYRTA